MFVLVVILTMMMILRVLTTYHLQDAKSIES